MEPQQEVLVYSSLPAVQIATNTFINVPIILQHDDVPLIAFVKEVNTIALQVPIYHPDGTQLAVVKGPRMFLTEPGTKAGLQLRHVSGVTVCQMNNQTLFEVRRDGAAAIAVEAELSTPHGYLLRVRNSGSGAQLFDATGGAIQLFGGGVVIARSRFTNFRYGIIIRGNRFAIATNNDLTGDV